MNKFTVLLALLAGWSVAAHAEAVYRYTDSQGVVHYTDKPPTKDAKPVNLPKIQTFRPGKPPKEFSFTGAPAANVPKFSLTIDSPSPDQTFRLPGESVGVSVNVMPGLVGGYGLLYAVDGEPVNEAPSFSTSISIPGLERGSHVITATLVDAKRQQQARASVTVHMKPPTAKR